MSPEAQKSFDAFVRWYHSQPNIKVLGVEQVCFSKTYDYAGTWDALLEIDGKRVLVDIKTTNASRDAPLGVYPENFLQLGAYSLAYREERNMGVKDRKWLEVYGLNDIDDLAIINCSKQGKVNAMYASDLGLSVEDCGNEWLHALNLSRGMKRLSKQIKEYKI